MHAVIKIPSISFSAPVFEEIRHTIGNKPAETGGILGGDPSTGQINRFFFDATADCSRVTYTVDAARINTVLRQWNAEGVHLLGFVHSHPKGSPKPSWQDIQFATRLLSRKDNNALPRFLIPIVQSAADGGFGFRMFAVLRELDNTIVELPFELTQDEGVFPVDVAAYHATFARVRESYSLPRLHNSLVVAIGCGGSAGYIDDLARCGVGRFLLVDPDLVQESNLATSAFFRRDVGKPKVKVLRDRIKEINDATEVVAIQEPIEAFSDADFRTLLFETEGLGEEAHARIICGMTDSFWAQMRASLIGLNFAVPYLAAQVYRGGRATEVVFTHAQTTRACSRCILAQRYRAYLEEGFRNGVGSEGAHYVATSRLNATKLFITLAILHHKIEHPFWGPMLTRIGQRNFVLTRLDPDLDQTLGLTQFQETIGGFVDDTVWRHQDPQNIASGYPTNCPDCGGTGDLMDSMGKFDDTRRNVAEAKAASRIP